MSKKHLKRKTLEAPRRAGMAGLLDQIKTPVGMGVTLFGVILIGSLIYFVVVLAQGRPIGATSAAGGTGGTGGTGGNKPLSSVPVAQRNGYFQAPPPMTIDPTKGYTATITVARGDQVLGNMVFRLFADKAPETVNNFVYLARQGFYDGTTFHRVIPGFMAQGGDPSGTGTGGPGYQFNDEPGATAFTFDDNGLLAMANSGPNTNGSQFFITFVPTPWLNGKHAIFGKIVSGQEVLMGIAARDPAQATAPGDVMKSVDITEGPPPPPLPTSAPLPTSTTAPAAPTAAAVTATAPAATPAATATK